MANIVAQEVTQNRVWVKIADGREFEITHTQMVDHYNNVETGPAPQRLRDTKIWAVNLFIAALGMENLKGIEKPENATWTPDEGFTGFVTEG